MPENGRLDGCSNEIELGSVEREASCVNLSMIPPDGEGLQPPFGRRRLRMTEYI